MDAVESYGERERIIKELNQAKLLFKERGFVLADCERMYRIAKARKILEYRAEGMAVTLITDLVRGNEDIAELAFNRDCAEVSFKSLTEAINILKLQLKVNETDIENERRGI